MLIGDGVERSARGSPEHVSIRRTSSRGSAGGRPSRRTSPETLRLRLFAAVRGWCRSGRWTVVAATVCFAGGLVVSAVASSALRGDPLVAAAGDRAWATLEVAGPWDPRGAVRRFHRSGRRRPGAARARGVAGRRDGLGGRDRRDRLGRIDSRGRARRRRGVGIRDARLADRGIRSAVRPESRRRPGRAGPVAEPARQARAGAMVAGRRASSPGRPPSSRRRAVRGRRGPAARTRRRGHLGHLRSARPGRQGDGCRPSSGRLRVPLRHCLWRGGDLAAARGPTVGRVRRRADAHRPGGAGRRPAVRRARGRHGSDRADRPGHGSGADVPSGAGRVRHRVAARRSAARAVRRLRVVGAGDGRARAARAGVVRRAAAARLAAGLCRRAVHPARGATGDNAGHRGDQRLGSGARRAGESPGGPRRRRRADPRRRLRRRRTVVPGRRNAARAPRGGPARVDCGGRASAGRVARCGRAVAGVSGGRRGDRRSASSSRRSWHGGDGFAS